MSQLQWELPTQFSIENFTSDYKRSNTHSPLVLTCDRNCHACMNTFAPQICHTGLVPCVSKSSLTSSLSHPRLNDLRKGLALFPGEMSVIPTKKMMAPWGRSTPLKLQPGAPAGSSRLSCHCTDKHMGCRGGTRCHTRLTGGSCRNRALGAGWEGQLHACLLHWEPFLQTALLLDSTC